MSHLSRRHLLKFATATSALAATGTIPAIVTNAFADTPATTKPATKALPWHNWSGNLSANPVSRIAPADEGELADILKSAETPVRMVGAGHSFSPLVPTSGTMLTLDRMAGVSNIDATTHQADVAAGTRLYRMSNELAEAGLSVDNLPDINKQSLAGALATSTHGAGAKLGAMPTFVECLRLMTASGKLIDCDNSKNPEIFQAARVSLGSLGVLTSARMQATPLFKLKRRTWVQPVEEMLERLPELEKTHRNFEFYYIPYSGLALGITNDLTDEAETPAPENMDDDGLRELKLLDDWLGWSPSLRRWAIQKALADYPSEERVDFAHKTLSAERGVRFNEMEYHLPRETAPDALRKIISTIEDNNIKVFFPIEFRTIAPDDIWLSPFYKRQTVSIAVHQFYEWDYLGYFAAIEPIFREHNGRPHWGKVNTLKAADFAALYPKWNDFLAVRKELDPTGKFLTPYMREVFGLA
jgi:FAD-linked oxidoreductase